MHRRGTNHRRRAGRTRHRSYCGSRVATNRLGPWARVTRLLDDAFDDDLSHRAQVCGWFRLRQRRSRRQRRGLSVEARPRQSIGTRRGLSPAVARNLVEHRHWFGRPGRRARPPRLRRDRRAGRGSRWRRGSGTPASAIGRRVGTRRRERGLLERDRLEARLDPRAQPVRVSGRRRAARRPRNPLTSARSRRCAPGRSGPTHCSPGYPAPDARSRLPALGATRRAAPAPLTARRDTRLPTLAHVSTSST